MMKVRLSNFSSLSGLACAGGAVCWADSGNAGASVVGSGGATSLEGAEIAAD